MNFAAGFRLLQQESKKFLIVFAKRAVLTALEQPLIEGLLEETYLFNQSCALPAAKERMNWFLQRDGQTREKELEMTDLVEEWKKWKSQN